jgi:aminoglycoside phosphotransferase (APT) family kinase protein
VAESVQPLTDVGIETLSEILDPRALARHLRGVSLGLWNREAVEDIEDIQVRVLKHHVGQRCTLEIGFPTEGGWHFLIGKTYYNDRFDVFQAMERIWQAGFGLRDEFSIPQPLAYLASMHLLLQEKVEGPVGNEIFKTGDERSRTTAAERCAQWLARFHAVGPKEGPLFNTERCLSLMRERSQRIAELGGRCTDKAARLREQLEYAGAALLPVEMRAGHGSYNPAQLILAEGRTVTCDWDGYDVADPARDVARFLAALRRLALGKLRFVRALDGAAEVFLRTYLTVGQPDAKRNLRFFLGDAYLTLATHDLSRSGDRWQQKAEAILDEGLLVTEMGGPL